MDKMHEQWKKLTWYNAISLRERVASRRTDANDTSSIAMHNTEIAVQRLQDWKAQKPFDHGTFFVDRLAMDAISEDDFFFLLAEPIEAVQTRASSTPGWLEELAEAFEDPYVSDEVTLLLQQAAAGSPLAACLRAIGPLLQHGVDRIRSGIQELNEQYRSLPFEPQRIIQVLFASLPRQLIAQTGKTFVLEMHVARPGTSKR